MVRISRAGWVNRYIAPASPVNSASTTTNELNPNESKVPPTTIATSCTEIRQAHRC